MSVIYSILIVVYYLILCYLVGLLGKRREIGFGIAFIASLLLSPFAGLLIALLSQDKSEKEWKEKLLLSIKKMENSKTPAIKPAIKKEVKKGTTINEMYKR